MTLNDVHTEVVYQMFIDNLFIAISVTLPTFSIISVASCDARIPTAYSFEEKGKCVGTLILPNLEKDVSE